MKYVKLKKQADFQKLFNKGKRAFSSTVTVLYAPYKETRMGISIGKRHGTAVKRNRIKRLIREAFRAVVGVRTVFGKASSAHSVIAELF